MKKLIVLLWIIIGLTGTSLAQSKVDKLIEKAFKCQERDDFPCLLEHGNDILEKVRQEPLGYYFRALYYWQKTHYDSAIADLQEASSLDREDADYPTLLGNIYYDLRDAGNARYYLRKALSLDSLNVDALIMLSDIDYNVDRGKDTVYLNWLFRLQPEHYYLEYRKGIDFYDQELYQQAIIHLEKAVYLNSEFDVGYYYGGMAMMYLDAIDPALLAMQKAIAINDQDPDYFQMQGYLYMEKDNYTAAIESSKKALALNPEQTNAWYNLAVSQMVEEQYSQALESLVQCFKYGDEPEDYYYIQGDIKYYMRGETAGCADWQKSLELGKLDAVEDLINYCPDYEVRTSL